MIAVWLVLLFGATAHAQTAASVHRVGVRIEGPLALVDVERAIALDRPRGGRPVADAVLDVDLPAGAVLVDWQVRGPGTVALAPTPPSVGRAAYQTVLKGAGLKLSPASADGADVRFRVAAEVAGGGEPIVRYRFVAPLHCLGGRLALKMPGTLEAAPAPAEVRLSFAGPAGEDVQLTGAELRMPGRRGKAGGPPGAWAPARAPWEVSFRPGGGSAAGALVFPPAAVVAGQPGGKGALAIGLCRPPRGMDEPLPARVLFVVDRSRSVGPAGLAAERELARALLEALPPSVRFNAIFFDRGQVTLFPSAREATREAISVLDQAMVPGSLANGSDLTAAMARAARLMADVPGQVAGATWVVVLTDGALPETLPAEIALPGAGSAEHPVRLAMLVVRPEDDDHAPPGSARALRAWAARVGGIARDVSPRGLRDSAAQVVADLRRGGDLFLPTLLWRGRSEITRELPVSLAVGTGTFAVLPFDGSPPASVDVMVKASGGGRPVSLTVAARRLGPRWGGGLSALPPTAWFAGSRRLAGLAERLMPAPEVPAPAVLGSARGQMDRDVVRNALSLTYLPRARPCYLSRSVKSAADVQLRGRLRLELLLERGEMREATVSRSTLGRPDIEACLREAAYFIDVPRAMHNDAPVVAALNLVFQPHTPATTHVDASAFSREIDLLLGPVTFSSDPAELLLPDPTGPTP